jgi:CBS domain-containing protein
MPAEVTRVRLANLVLAPAESNVMAIDDPELVSVRAGDDRESVLKAFEKYDRTALPVTDDRGYLLGIIAVDDVLDIAEQRATEDIQKLGGSEALGASYLDVRFTTMLRKRGGWLAALFLGEMLTATAMSYFQAEIARAVHLLRSGALDSARDVVVAVRGATGVREATRSAAPTAAPLRSAARRWYRALLLERPPRRRGDRSSAAGRCRRD